MSVMRELAEDAETEIKNKISTFRLVPNPENQGRSTRHGGFRHVAGYPPSIQIAKGQGGDDTSGNGSTLEKEQGEPTKIVATGREERGEPSKADTETVSPHD
ncbi:hypothetical protein FRC00_004152 [Tulasnella sp. 408]|nr:hypothetical protein FRC00_004152 [Tulasnella sp. 408]